MDKLTNIGLRIDEREKLKIINETVEQGSQTLAQKCRQFLETMESLKESLNKTESILERLTEQSEKTKIVCLAAGITSSTKPEP